MADHFANGYWDGDYWVESYFGTDVAGSMSASLSGAGSIAAAISGADNVVAVTTAGRRSGATSYRYRTLGNERRERERELAKIARRAQRKVAAALEDAPKPEGGLVALVTREVTATAPKARGLSTAVLNGIVDSIVAYHRNVAAPEFNDGIDEEEEDFEVLLLLAA